MKQITKQGETTSQEENTSQGETTSQTTSEGEATSQGQITSQGQTTSQGETKSNCVRATVKTLTGVFEDGVQIYTRTGGCWTRSGNHPAKTQAREETVSLLVPVYTRTGGCWSER